MARRPNQSILKKINHEYSLEGLRLKLRLQYIGYLMRRAHSLQKNQMLGMIEGRRRREEKGATGNEVVSWHLQLNGHEFELTVGNSDGQVILLHCSLLDCKKFKKI